MDKPAAIGGIGVSLDAMPRVTHLPEPLRRTVFLGSDAVKKDQVTPTQLRSKAVRRLMHDAYADATLPVDHGLRIAAAALVVPDLVAIAGQSAAWLYGVRLARAGDPVEVVAKPTVRRHARGRITVHTGSLPDRDVQKLGRFRVTTPARTCVDSARWYRDEENAVALVDAMLAARVVTKEAIAEQLHASTGRGLVRASRALALVDARAESPPESVLRVRVIRAGLPPPVAQLEIWHDGSFVARVDLGWLEAKVALEYDGAWHAAPGQLARDRRRLNALTQAGWTVIFVTAADLHDMSHVFAQLQAALRAHA